jgi:glutamate mutase epsilon subunit
LVVFDDKYERLTDEELRNMYSELESRFVSGNKFDADNMGQFHYAMKTGAEFSREMARSVKEALKSWDGKEL